MTTPTQTLLAICDLAELPPIIPPWTTAQLEPAWPVWWHSQPVAVEVPEDPWYEAHIEASER